MQAPRRLVLSLIATWSVVVGASCFLQEGDPYRIGVQLADDGSPLSILYADCGRDVRITSVMLGHERSKPSWRITSGGVRASEFVVGVEPPPGFEVDVPLDGTIEGHYLISIDSSYLAGESYTFSTRELVPGRVLFGRDQIIDRHEFASRAEC